jgi:acetolactate synthase-1/3 small subunit
MTGGTSKIEGLIQVLRESGYTILEVSRTGRMAMRRGHHTSRVLQALGQANGIASKSKPGPGPKPKPSAAEIIPSEFPNIHDEE